MNKRDQVKQKLEVHERKCIIPLLFLSVMVILSYHKNTERFAPHLHFDCF